MGSGEQGKTGATGATGETGTTGETGATGETMVYIDTEHVSNILGPTGTTLTAE